MPDKVGKHILFGILAFSLLFGIFIMANRYFLESKSKMVELCIDLNDIKKMASFEKKPLLPILQQIRNLGITSIGVFEETLPDANALGEIYYSKGSGIIRLKTPFPAMNEIIQKGKIKPEKTYIFTPFDNVRKRIFNQLKCALGAKSIKFYGKNMMEIDEQEEEIRNLGLGISETQQKTLTKLGYKIIPRLWNDPHYNFGNIEDKISGIKSFGTIIFDGEELLGYPDGIKALADALRKYQIKYGYIEIVKQEGDRQLLKLLGQYIRRTHSVPKDELKKINKDEAFTRFVRAARERKIDLIYIRPFLPPQVDAYPVEYNLKYLSELKNKLEKAGFSLGTARPMQSTELSNLQIVILGLGIIAGFFLLLNYFLAINYDILFIAILPLCLIGLSFLCFTGFGFFLQNLLGFSAAVIFPSLAVIHGFSQTHLSRNKLLNATAIVLNIVGITLLGAFLMAGMFADSRFLLGIKTFPAVKLALILPILIIALYFTLSPKEGNIKGRFISLMNSSVTLGYVVLGIIILGVLGIFIARSGNFTLPVPGFEKIFRSILETLLFIRPRTKEFLIGYPFLFIAAYLVLSNRKKWLWLFSLFGAIAPISVLNSFSHIHTPIIVSILRTFSGLVLGFIIGLIVFIFVDRFNKA